MVHFEGARIRQTEPGLEKTWSIPELLSAYRPFGDEPLAEQNELSWQ